MKIEAGKFYRTRDGRKARVYAVDGTLGTSSEIHGAVFHGGAWGARQWSKSGSYNNTIERELDIVSEWAEPAPKLIAWVPVLTSLCNGYCVVRFSSADYAGEPGWRRAPWMDEP